MKFSSFASTSAPLPIRREARVLWPCKAARCRGVRSAYSKIEPHTNHIGCMRCKKHACISCKKPCTKYLWASSSHGLHLQQVLRCRFYHIFWVWIGSLDEKVLSHFQGSTVSCEMQRRPPVLHQGSPDEDFRPAETHLTTSTSIDKGMLSLILATIAKLCL